MKTQVSYKEFLKNYKNDSELQKIVNEQSLSPKFQGMHPRTMQAKWLVYKSYFNA